MSPPLAPAGRRSPYGRDRDDGAHAARAAPLPPGRGGTRRASRPAHGAGDADRRRARRPRHRASPPPASGSCCPAPRRARWCCPCGTATSSSTRTAPVPSSARSRPSGSTPNGSSSTWRSSSTATGHSRRGQAGLGPATAPPSRGPDAATTIDQAARSFLLAGDESALPAIAMLLDELPEHGGRGGVHRGRRTFGPSGARDTSRRGRGVVRPRGRGAAGLRRSDRRGHGRVRAGRAGVGRRGGGGDATAASSPLRRAGLSRSQVVVRGYWKHGRQGDAADE